MVSWSRVVIGGALLGLLVACGGDDDSGTGGSGGTGTGGMGAMGGGTTTSSATGGGGSGGDSGSPQAPVIDTVEPMDGGLHVMWTNVTPDCDTVELDRNQDGGAYATVFTLTGVADEQHDPDASVATSTYCYKARCTKGTESSPDSSEKCGMP